MTDQIRHSADKAAKKQRGRPFKKGQSGNPAGCRSGSRHKATIIAQALLDGEAEGLTRRVIEQALAGDVMCLRICLERLVPPRKDSPVLVSLPEVKTAKDIATVTGALLQAVASGTITPSEAQALTGLVDMYRKAVETADLEQRISSLEERMRK
jgi:hypothetical protein